MINLKDKYLNKGILTIKKIQQNRVANKLPSGNLLAIFNRCKSPRSGNLQRRG